MTDEDQDKLVWARATVTLLKGGNKKALLPAHRSMLVAVIWNTLQSADETDEAVDVQITMSYADLEKLAKEILTWDHLQDDYLRHAKRIRRQLIGAQKKLEDAPDAQIKDDLKGHLLAILDEIEAFMGITNTRDKRPV